MSAKAFYQTFYQTEQLFRRADEALAFPPRYDTPDELLSPSVATETLAEAAEPVDSEPITITINDPVLAATPADVLIPATVITEPEPTPQSVADTKPPVSRKPVAPQISQKVLILVDDELLPSDLLFLEKILKAVHLDIDGVDLLNVHGTSNVDFNELLKGKYIHHFFTFGVPFNRINLDILMDRYQPVRFDGITFLMADPLPAIETDVVLKKKLWEALKKVFLWR